MKDTTASWPSAVRGRELGFDGKTLITGQVAGANEAFAPSERAVEDARGILQAWEDGKGSGVVTYNGRMIENLHVESARRTLSINDAVIASEMRSKPARETFAARFDAGRVGTCSKATAEEVTWLFLV